MTHIPTNEEMKKLAKFARPLSLTMYIPYIEPNTPADPNRIELKDMLRDAIGALADAGASPEHIEKTVAPIEMLMDRQGSLLARDESMAIFSHPKLFQYYTVPGVSVPYALSVGKGFDTAPLQQVVDDNQEYLLLALSHKNVTLYKGDHYELHPMELEGLPKDMKQSLRIDEYPNSRETHPIAPAGMGKGSEGFHQQYNVRQTDKTMLKEFFRRIDKRLHPFLTTNQLPLVLAGVGYLLPIYRSVNTYSRLLPSGITGNVDRTSPQAIQKDAWRLVARTSH